MDLGLAGKPFVVGGASRGLGRAVAEQLVAEGARAILVSRDENALAETSRRLGEGAHPLAADLSDPRSVEEIAGAAKEIGGDLGGVLVNSGGPPFGAALDLDDEQWLAAFSSLVAGLIRLLRALVPLMGDGASVLFVTSSSVRQPIPNLDASTARALGISKEEARSRASEALPMGRCGEPEEFGRAAAFLLSPAASYINGVSLQVDGGSVSALP